MPNPFFSVIIPTYNRGTLLASAIKSVLEQTFISWELIIVDDGSTDNTRNVVASFNDNRIIYLYQTNSERSVARNYGISRAAGQYICFLDSDDCYFNDHLKHLYDAISRHNFIEGVFITGVVRSENGILTKVKHEPLQNHTNAVCFILLSEESIIPARVCIHSNILQQYKFNPNLHISEDAELFTRIGAKYPFIQVPFHTVLYHLHESNTTHKDNNPFADQLLALHIIFGNPDLKKFIPRKVKNQKLSQCYFGIARYYQYTRQYFRMIPNLIKSLVLNPFSPTSKTKLYLIIRLLPEAFFQSNK